MTQNPQWHVARKPMVATVTVSIVLSLVDNGLVPYRGHRDVDAAQGMLLFGKVLRVAYLMKSSVSTGTE